MADPYGSLTDAFPPTEEQLRQQGLEKLKAAMTPPTMTQRVMQALGRVYTATTEAAKATTDWFDEHLKEAHVGAKIEGVGDAKIAYEHKDGEKTLDVQANVSIKKKVDASAGFKLNWKDAPAAPTAPAAPAAPAAP